MQQQSNNKGNLENDDEFSSGIDISIRDREFVGSGYFQKKLKLYV
jgi:hypothetical protein